MSSKLLTLLDLIGVKPLGPAVAVEGMVCVGDDVAHVGPSIGDDVSIVSVADDVSDS